MDLLEYNASLIWNLVPFDSIMFDLPKPSMKFVVSDMVFTLTFINVKPRPFFISKNCVCGYIVNKTYITLIHLEINNI